MAAWGSGNFENDDAQDWLDQLTELSADDLKPLLSRAEDSEYLEAPESSVMVAAAEAIAALKGAPAAVAPKQIADWTLAAKSSSNVSVLPDLITLAVSAVKRVRTNSELKDLWLEADGLNEWSANLRDLEQRLVNESTP